MARKINTRFILIVALIVGGLMVSAGGVYYYKKKHKDPRKLLAIAEQSEKEGALVVAAQHYRGAGTLMRDPKLMTKAGDLLWSIAYDDDDNLKSAYGCWEQAIGTDPTYTPALERELNYWMEVKNAPSERPSPVLYDNIQSTAKKILKNDPKHLAARIAIPISTIDSWSNHIETEQTQVDKAVKDLTDLQKEDPKNADLPYYIARAYVTQAARAMQNNTPAEAEKLNASAESVMEDALKGDPENGKLYFRAAQIILNELTPPGDKDKALAKIDRARPKAMKASELIKPTDPEYDDVKTQAATLARDPENLKKDPKSIERDADAIMKDQAAQEKVYRDALKERPNDVVLRVRLGEMLGQRNDRRDEAIEMLSNLPEPSPADRAGMRGFQLKNMQLQALSSLTNFRLDKMASLKTKSEQDAMLPQIESDFHKLETRAPDSPFILRIKAKLELAKGEITDAIATLTQALPRTDDRNPMRYELMYLLAKCYLATNQSGSAKAYLEQIVNSIPSYDEARILLTETQLKEFNFKDAEPNLAILEQKDHSPGDIRVIRMRIADLEQQKKSDEAKAFYAKLPEQTRVQKLDKATVAFLMKQQDEAKRLIESVASADPGDLDAAMMLSAFYKQNKDLPNAMAALDRALKAKPDNPDLLLARAQLSGSSPQEMKQIRLKEAEKIAQPLERELALFELTSNDTDENIPVGHLKAAEQIDPKDPRVLTGMFEYNMARHNWDQASPYLEKLADLNADKVKGTLLRWRLYMARAGAEQDGNQRNAWLLKSFDLATQLTHDYPEFELSWQSMAQTEEAMGHFEDAIPHFISARDKQPTNPEPYRGLIDCYYQLKRPEDAGKIIDKACDAMPGVPLFKELKLEYEMQYGDPEKVVAEREKAVAADPENSQTLMSLAQAYASVARAKNAKTETEKQADAWLEKAKATLAKGAEKFPDELQFCITHGVVCQMLKQVDQGEKLWKATLAREQWKDNVQAIGAFADFYLRANRTDDAQKILRDYLASAAGKNNLEITLKLIDILASQKKFDDAIVLVDSIPNNPQLQLRKVDLLINQGKLPDAEKLIQNLMQQKKTPELMSAMAYVYLNSDRIPQAQELLNQVLTERPGMTNALFFRAMATLRTPKAKVDDAVSDLVQVRDAAPQNLQARYLLVDALQRINDNDSAIKELEGILRVRPSEKAARMKLMDLYATDTPPRWLDAERVARDGDAQPELTTDVDFLAAEARLFSKRGDTDRAVTYMTRAMKAQPQNITLVRAYYGILITGKKYRDMLNEADKLPKETQDQWWVHAFRGAAHCKLGEKPAGLQEFVAALNATVAAKEDASSRLVVDQMADAAGADSALKVVAALPQSAEPRWQLIIAFLQMRNQDLPSARKTIDGVLNNSDKLSPQEQQIALSFAGSVYMQTPNPNFDRARDVYLQLLKLTPDDFSIYNNLACNKSVTAAQALEYGQKAYQLMQEQRTFEPLVADTYGWSLVQSGDDRNLDVGLNVLLEAWNAKHIVDIAYHLGEAYLKKNNGPEADRYLTMAQSLYTEALNNNQVVDNTLQPSIVDAQTRASKLKGKKGL